MTHDRRLSDLSWDELVEVAEDHARVPHGTAARMLDEATKKIVAAIWSARPVIRPTTVAYRRKDQDA